MKFILKSLFNNNTCITGARKKPWWIAIILLIISIIFSLVPSFVLRITSKGSAAFTTGTTYGLDYGVQYFVDEANENGIKLVVDNEKKVVATNWEEGSVGEIAYYYLNDQKNHGTSFFYAPDYSNETFSFDKINIGTANAGLLQTNHNAIIFGKQSLFIFITKPDTDQTYTSVWNNAYSKFDEGYDIIENLKGKTQLETRNKFFTFLDSAYKTQNVSDTWVQTGIYASISLIVTLIFGLMIFILTRGKNNPYRMYTFWEGMKISFWCTLSPAILAIPLGFLLGSSLGTMMYPFILGIRVMWLTMRSLRPDGTGYNE